MWLRFVSQTDVDLFCLFICGQAALCVGLWRPMRVAKRRQTRCRRRRRRTQSKCKKTRTNACPYVCVYVNRRLCRSVANEAAAEARRSELLVEQRVKTKSLMLIFFLFFSVLSFEFNSPSIHQRRGSCARASRFALALTENRNAESKRRSSAQRQCGQVSKQKKQSKTKSKNVLMFDNAAPTKPFRRRIGAANQSSFFSVRCAMCFAVTSRRCRGQCELAA